MVAATAIVPNDAAGRRTCFKRRRIKSNSSSKMSVLFFETGDRIDEFSLFFLVVVTQETREQSSLEHSLPFSSSSSYSKQPEILRIQ